MEKSKPFTTPTLSHDEKEDHARKKANIVAGSSRRKRWRFPTSWWRSTPIWRASSGGPQLTFSSMKMLSQVCTLYDANLNTLLMLLLSAFTAFNEEHFKQALERLDYVFAKYIFKVTSNSLKLIFKFSQALFSNSLKHILKFSQVKFSSRNIRLNWKDFRETIYQYT